MAKILHQIILFRNTKAPSTSRLNQLFQTKGHVWGCSLQDVRHIGIDEFHESKAWAAVSHIYLIVKDHELNALAAIMRTFSKRHESKAWSPILNNPMK